MPFRLSWGALPRIVTGSLGIAAEGSGFTLIQTPFGPPGTILDRLLQPSSDPFDFRLFLFNGNDRLTVDCSRIGQDDIFSLMLVQPNAFVASFFHQGAVTTNCTITCSDRTQGQGCVTCRDPPMIIKVCC